MKIAVLVSGELRTFDRCRMSMGFLDDPRVTVFVSTWRRTEHINKILKIEHAFDTSEEDVREILGDVKIGGIIVEETNPFTSNDRYNCPMVHRWIEGLKMIGDDFDLVVVVRPDMFFLTTDNLLDGLVPTHRVTMKFLNSFDLKQKKLHDVAFSGTVRTMKKIFNQHMLDSWRSSLNDDWHIWFFNYVRPRVLDLECLSWPTNWGRPNMGLNPTFKDVSRAADIWRDSIICKQRVDYGMAHVLKYWGQENVDRVQRLASDGFFDRYAEDLKTRN